MGRTSFTYTRRYQNLFSFHSVRLRQVIEVVSPARKMIETLVRGKFSGTREACVGVGELFFFSS